MKKIILIAISLIFVGCPKFGVCQEWMQNIGQIPEANIWSFIKYGQHSPNLYTGTITTSIPIYTYKDSDFEIPISLNYASNGYIPNMQASSVGLGWFLSANGYIVRTNCGVEDDSIGARLGFYYGFKSDYVPRILNDVDIFNHCSADGNSFFKPYYWINELPHETTPDIHTFNFMGHTGKFIMDFGHKVHVYNTNHANGVYDVDLSNYPCTFKPGENAKDTSQIIITTGDGYKYLFARPFYNTGCYLSYEYHGEPGFYWNSFHKNYWLLTQIEAPNGRTVLFEYDKPEATDRSQYMVNKYLYDEEQSLTPLKSTREYVSQLKAIKIGKFEIRFNYSKREPEKVHHIEWNIYNMEGTPDSLLSLKKLNDISIYNGTKVIKTCNLFYDTAKYENEVLFLKKVYISGEGYYQMDYYNENYDFPKHATTNIDHWGYYNKPEYEKFRYNENLKPQVSIDDNDVETILSSNRNPNFEACQQGTIKIRFKIRIEVSSCKN